MGPFIFSRESSVSLFASRLHLEFASLKFLSTKPDRYRKLGIFNRCSGKHEVAWIPGPSFVPGVTAESPVRSVSLGQQNLGAHSEGAFILEDQTGIILVFKMERCNKPLDSVTLALVTGGCL